MSNQLRLQQATALLQSGRLSEAQALYRQILATEPDHADALHLLGITALQSGRPAEAEGLIRRAVGRQPDGYAYLNSLGNALRALGRHGDAETAYRAALRLQPNIPDFHHHLGLSLKDQGRAGEAETAWRHALRLKKDFVAARIDLGNLLVESGRGADAEACLRAAVRVAPANKVALNALGLALAAQGKHQEALDQFDQALREDPAYLTALANRATSLSALDRMEEAADSYRAALKRSPDAEDLKLGLSRALLDLQLGPELETLLRDVLTTRPADPDVLHGLGAALAMQDRNDEALSLMEAALAADPTHALAWHAKGTILRDMVRWRDSHAAYAEAIRLAPEDARFNASLAYSLLTQGDFESGWPYFEWRVRMPGNARLKEPLWDGAPTDRIVLVHAEQGVGDNIQFARFIPEAVARARILLGCPKSLHLLFSQFAGVTEIVVGEPVPPYDVHCPIMSLPYVLGIRPDMFGDSVPYLHADPSRVAAWEHRLAPLRGRRVGVAWAGNPKYPADRHRSIPYACFAPLLATEGVSFVSLQMGEAKHALDPDAAFDASPWLEDLADTAALIATLDLVISVDTAVAHLAGALGAPVWLLNRANTDWRWLLDRADSPWYPSLRQFRQPAPGDWHSVIASVMAALA
jgi:tetratricopeptide (TPR) repeat protein